MIPSTSRNGWMARRFLKDRGQRNSTNHVHPRFPFNFMEFGVNACSAKRQIAVLTGLSADFVVLPLVSVREAEQITYFRNKHKFSKNPYIIHINNEVRYRFCLDCGFCHRLQRSSVRHPSCRKGPCHQGCCQEIPFLLRT